MRAVDRIVQGLRELGEPVVVAAEHRGHDLLLPAQQAPDRDEEEDDARRCERNGGRVDRDRHLERPLPLDVAAA